VANYVFSSKNGTDKNIKSHKSIMWIPCLKSVNVKLKL
jgi:hypothetical protein